MSSEAEKHERGAPSAEGAPQPDTASEQPAPVEDVPPAAEAPPPAAAPTGAADADGADGAAAEEGEVAEGELVSEDAPPAAAAAPPSELTPEEQAAKYLALAQRTQADFENYRKRMAREVAAASDRGMAKLVKELLPALDHMDLALRAAAEDDSELAKGIRLVQGELVAALGRAGIQAFSPVGEPFDPNEHEAMAQQPSDDAESGTVLTVYQSGYRLNGQVLRPARVVVAA